MWYSCPSSHKWKNNIFYKFKIYLCLIIFVKFQIDDGIKIDNSSAKFYSHI